MRRLAFVGAATIAAALAFSVLSGAAPQAEPKRVTLIGDSVATALPGFVPAIQKLAQGVDLQYDVQPCRRLVDASCPPNPPSTLDVIRSLGSKLGPAVVISVGYNDFEVRYADEIEDVLGALRAAGVDRVFWLTLRAAHHPYVNMNADIADAARRHPEVEVVEWNVYSRSHPEWFQDDGLHMLAPGALAMATLIHQNLVDAGVAAPPVAVATTALPVARVKHPYSARLRATGGLAPLTWRLAGRLPKGLHLRPSGVFWGTPRAKPGPFTFTVRVQDSANQSDAHEFSLRLR